MTRTSRQKRIRKARNEGLLPRPGCPHPLKRAYKDEEAIRSALRNSRYSGRPIAIYECACGTLHLTKRKQK